MGAMEYPMKREEKVLFGLRALYQRHGYAQYKMGKFEEYDLYARNKDFLVSEGIITFTDTDGRLMALKPDVTLSIIKNTRDVEGCVQKVCYSENVYRISGSTRQFKEIMQAGLECIGDVDSYSLCEVLALASESLEMIDPDNVLELSHMGVVSALVNGLELEANERAMALACVGEKNLDGLKKLCPGRDLDGVAALIGAHGRPADVIAAKNRITYLIDCKVCSDGSFRLSRMEENQRRAMNLWTETGNGSGWFALKMPDESIYMMFMDLLLRWEAAGRSEVTEEEIRRIGVQLEEWLETFVCW